MAEINNDIDDEFEEELETIKSMYPDQISIENNPINIKCIITDKMYMIQTTFSKTNDGRINIKVSNHEKCTEQHSKVYLNKIESKLNEICKENSESMPIFQCIAYLNESVMDDMKNNQQKNNQQKSNDVQEEKKNDNDCNNFKAPNGNKGKTNNQSNYRFRFKHNKMHKNNDNIDEYDYHFAYNYKHYVKDAWNTDQFVFFYKDIFSQWFPSKFIIDNITYCNCEQYMMAEKAKLFNDDEYWQLIMNQTDPNKIKKLGRGVRNFNEKIWKQNCQQIVYKGNLAKFTQNDILKNKLLSYDKSLYFVEASGVDKIWGIGLKVTDPTCKRKANWKGLNLLGKAITKVRDDIIKQNL